ncbi:MAG: YdeI/OmpD-associated family protein [Pseudomonadota bacterium]
MSINTEDYQKVSVVSSDALWQWLGEHHAQAASVWLVTFKKSQPDKYISRDEVLDALVAFGWIDGIRRVLDDTRTMQLIAPRKQQAWAQSYKERASRLIDDGRMQQPGLASIQRGKNSGLWDFFADVDALIVPDDLNAALKEDVAKWDGLARSYRRNVLRWIKLAKTDATRTKRIDAAALSTRTDQKIAQM